MSAKEKTIPRLQKRFEEWAEVQNLDTTRGKAGNSYEVFATQLAWEATMKFFVLGVAAGTLKAARDFVNATTAVSDELKRRAAP